MEQLFWCAAWPDIPMARKRLSRIAGIRQVTIQEGGYKLTVQTDTLQNATQAAIQLRELGWRLVPG